VRSLKPLPPKRLYTVKETGHAIGCGPTTVYGKINDGVLVAVKYGYRTYITAESIDRYIASLTPAVTPTMAKAAHERGDTSVEANPLHPPQGHQGRTAAKRAASVKATFVRRKRGAEAAAP
jgi:hypothetical protein